jgi:hypothetical protein
MWRCAGVEGSPRLGLVWWETPVRITAIQEPRHWPISFSQGNFWENTTATRLHKSLSVISYCCVCRELVNLDSEQSAKWVPTFRIKTASLPFPFSPEYRGSWFLRNLDVFCQITLLHISEDVILTHIGVWPHRRAGVLISPNLTLQNVGPDTSHSILT